MAFIKAMMNLIVQYHFQCSVLSVSFHSNSYKTQGRQSSFKTGVVDPGLKTGDVVGPKNSADGGTHSTGLRVSSPEFLFNNKQIYLFPKNHHFCTFCTL